MRRKQHERNFHWCINEKKYIRSEKINLYVNNTKEGYKINYFMIFSKYTMSAINLYLLI